MLRKLSAKVKRERAAARKAARELEDERKARRTDGVEDICNGIAQPITRFFHKMNGYDDVKEKRNCSAFEKNAPKKKKHKMVVDKTTNKENVDGVEDKKPMRHHWGGKRLRILHDVWIGTQCHVLVG